MQKILVIILCLLLGLLTLGCSTTQNASDEIIVFGASSLESVLKDLAKKFQEKTGITVVLNLGGSQRLSTQIEQGLPVHLFISANGKQTEKLKEKKLLFNLKPVAHNKIVLAVSTSSKIKELRDLSGKVQLALGNEEVPIGRYSREVLNNLSHQYFEKDFQEKTINNVVSFETSVKQVLARIASGQVDGGFVYATDILVTNPPLQYIEIPANANIKTNYIMGLSVDGQENDNAQKFYDFILSKQGKKIFEKYGFIVEG